MKNLDERQLLINGQAYKHGMLLLILIILLDAFLTDSSIVLFEGMWGNILTIAVATTFIYTELIIRNAINYDDKSGICVFSTLGVIGLFLLIMSVIHISMDGIVYDGSYIIPKSITRLIIAIAWTWIGVFYWFKRSRVKYDD